MVLDVLDQFPWLVKRRDANPPFIYLDSAATTHKPGSVVKAVMTYYQEFNSNVHRSLHNWGSKATSLVEGVREAVADFVHGSSSEEIIFTAGTTASINLVASAYGELHVGKGDDVVVSVMEHHSNLLPWRRLCERVGAKLSVVPVMPDGELDRDAYRGLLTRQTKLVALSYVSNVLGTCNPLGSMIKEAHDCGAVVLVDAAQAVAHFPIDVQALDCDFLAFSSHKMYGPTGIGVLYGRKGVLAQMIPYQMGGGMVQEVNGGGETYAVSPHCFEAGTLHLAGVAGLGAAIAFLKGVGFGRLQQHEADLLGYAMEGLRGVPGLRVVGNPSRRVAIVPFVMEGKHSLDIGLLLDSQRIAVRTGSLCAMPLLHALSLPGVVRLSFAMYNTLEEVDRLIGVLRGVIAKK